MIVEQAAAVPYLWGSGSKIGSADVNHVSDRANGGSASLAFTSLRR